jgi:O-methyltransferase involved in polyketide biosynthesis
MNISRTSQAVALTRAGLDRPHTAEGDPDAQRKLCAGMAPVSAGRLGPQVEARTRFFDEQVLSAIAAGVRQIVICGAGYDDRALRFRTAGVRFFELDHPATQAAKARRLADLGVEVTGAAGLTPEGGGGAAGGLALAGSDGGSDDAPGGLTLAGVDFRGDDVAAVLAGCGHCAGRPTLFLCEGLLVYLDQPTITGLLGGLAARAAAGSTLAASLSAHPPGLDSGQVVAAANARRRAADSEPWLTILPADACLGLLAQGGWQVAATVDAATLDDRVEPGRSLLVTARPTR